MAKRRANPMVSASGLKHPAQPLQHFGRFAAPLGLLDHPLPHEIQQPGLQVQVRFPEFAIVDVFDSFPDARFAAVLLPAGPEMAVVKAEHLRRQPGRHVHAVGDVADRNLVFRLARIQPRPHCARDFAVQRRYRIGAARELQAQHRHAEIFAADCPDSRAPAPSAAPGRVPSASRNGPRCSSIRSASKRS